ncbi:MAG: malto-oligosyltrehalose synthase, partial [Mucilaginibacter sp.]|nr:malto-oligosyltrehalose synthase [Mucilaginibacter sp.]
SINGTSTHDTKRGEDVRARLNVLTDMGEEWISTVSGWQKINADLKQSNAPDANDEYLIYQTLAGAYPMPGEGDDNFNERLQAYLTKALREAKVHTGWAEPDEQYEKGTLEFAAKLLDQNSLFWKGFTDLQSKVADHAVVNSLVQVLLKFTCPGVPDVYQGCELWDFSLVDPDNRRPVDYKIRDQYVADNSDITQLWAERYTGRIKLWLTDLLLHLRKENTKTFAHGIYIPLKVKGKYKDKIIAFARQYLNDWFIIIAPLHTAALNAANLLDHDWKDTSIIIQEDAPLQWEDILNGKPLIINEEIVIKDLFKSIPLSILRSSKSVSKRSAGIIMHITSLPSVFGVGDLGPEARKFADFLSNANQKYWQLLPLNPTGAGAYNSPYSSFSSMAGNTLLISPEDLMNDGLLTPEELQSHLLPSGDKVNFEAATANKKILLAIAFERFKKVEKNGLQADYSVFKQKEAYWLDDFVLYEVLKDHHQDRPWYEWADQFKCRDDEAISDFNQEHAAKIDQQKWLQFMFFKQWTALRNYGNDLGIKFFGDLPFYVSYDSADVWTHPEIFKLDENKEMAGIAGVPPDYFNTGGQLWGMPVYDWENLAKTNYGWWVDRIRKNMEFFDVVRLDHFRAFYDYWEVPAGEENAINGTWKFGPGTELFKTLKNELGDIPFIAEDLGDVSQGVYDLRDELNLPGMNLLQYAFGADMPVSIHIPHNHIINSVTYTGTHDNNTTKGWFKQNSSKEERNNLRKYTKLKVNKQNVQQVLTELCYASVSEIAIVPLQDILGLDEKARMNMPSSKDGNWLWQLKRGLLTTKVEKRLKNLVKLYNR